MWSFIISVCALIAGYFLYGKFVERIFCPENRVTPAIKKNDGVDYVPMPTWKVFMVQFLNIAGTGPIFGAIMGAKFGPSCYLWIVFGCIFAGAVHDYLSGMMSVRNGGATVPDLVGYYWSRRARVLMLIVSIVLLLLVGTVFVYSPALILGDIADIFGNTTHSIMFWTGLVFVYYIIATLLPVDKVIGKIYPIFAFALLFMAFGLMICLFVKWPAIPELWNGLQNRGPEVGMDNQPIFPYIFVTIACGALSGFHSTQSPIMARCLKDEHLGRPVFYGAMITEGIVALIWAAVASYFFFDGGMIEVGAKGGQAPEVVTSVARSWLGIVGGILAVLGVVAAPITSGDTAFRSARLIIADFLHIDQKANRNRLFIAIPLFALASVLLWYNITNEEGFNIIWRYFGCANQLLAAIVLWMITMFLDFRRRKGAFVITLLPAAFMTAVCVTYLAIDKIGFGVSQDYIWIIACTTFVVTTASYLIGRQINREARIQKTEILKDENGFQD